MGKSVNFTCPQCNYETVCTGGRSEGFRVVSETLTCKRCKDVVNVPVEQEIGDDLKLGRCANCGGTDLTPWPESHPCPKCDGTLVQGSLVEFWD